MAYKLSIPFYAFKLHLHSGVPFLLPITDKEVFRVGQPIYLLAGKYAEVLEREVLNKGQHHQLLDEFLDGQFLRNRLSIDFPAAKDGYSFPEFSLEFDFFINERENGIWGIVPALGVEAYAPTEERLHERLGEAIRLDFARKRRLQAVQQIVSAVWFDIVELNQSEIDLKVPTPRELDKMSEDHVGELLPDVARPLKINRQVVYGRKGELQQMTKVLKGRYSRNLLIVGPSGVGKTAMVWELARQQKKRRIKGVFWETTASVMIKELMRDTGWQHNLSNLCKELAQTEDILFIRNLMELFEVGKYEGNSVSIAEYMRTYISRGEVTVVSECTEEELSRIELESPNFVTLFQVLRLQEPKEGIEDIILKKVKDIAASRNVEITEEAIQEVIRLNRRFMPYSGMPGKPIRFLESILINKRNEGKEGQSGPLRISRSEVIRHFCEESGMPLFMVDPSIPMNTLAIKTDFNAQLFGQQTGVESVVDLLASVKTALTRTGKPIASFLFVGPTGVGKTELAKILAAFMFGSRQRMVRFDMSEYSSPYAVSRLTGSNYFSDGLLTSEVRKEPFTVLLFDEIEKAHPNFFDLLLQLLSEGRLTDSRGKLVNFCSSIIIMTSNIGAGKLQNGTIGWKKDIKREAVLEHFMGAVERHFRPELFNRIDQVIPFYPLEPDTVRFVVEREIDLFRKREGIQFRRMDLNISEEVLDHLTDKGYNSLYGARQLQRTIKEELIHPLAKELNLHDFDDQLMVSVSIRDGAISIQIEADPLGLELLLEELAKINQADIASSLRRKINRMIEGHLFIRLINELDILERKKKKKRKLFWKNQRDAEKYSYFLETRSNVEGLLSEIEAFEMKLAMASLSMATYNPTIEKDLEKWEKKFFDLKVELISRLAPVNNSCHFAIYGSNLDMILWIYLDIFKRKGFNFTAYSVWFRDKYYNEEITVVPDSDEGDPGGLVKKRREEYVKEEISSSASEWFRPPQKGDVLYGIEFVVVGPCATLFLEVELGGQRWKSANNQDHLFVIQASNRAFLTPKNIHRKEFYTRKKDRRTFEQGIIKDKPYNLNREYNRSNLVDLLLGQMDKLFEQRLDDEALR